MQRLDRLVRRHEDENPQALTDQAVHDVEKARQLADDRLRVRSQELACVLEHEEPPGLAAFVTVLRVAVRHEAACSCHSHEAWVWHLRVAGLRQDTHQVVGVLAEERIRVDDVVELAPVPPLPGERAQREGLPRAGLAVPEDQLAAVCRMEVAHERVELLSRGRAVVVLEIRPLRYGDLAVRRERPMLAVGPELNVDLVRGARIRRWKDFLQLVHHGRRSLGIVPGHLRLDPAGIEPQLDERPVPFGENVVASLSAHPIEGFPQRVQRPRRCWPAADRDLLDSALEHPGREECSRSALCRVNLLRQVELVVEVGHAGMMPVVTRPHAASIR